MRKLGLTILFTLLCRMAAAQTSGQLMYVGTLDKKLLVIDEVREEVVGEIPLGGIPRTTALSADKKKLYINISGATTELTGVQCNKYTYH